MCSKRTVTYNTDNIPSKRLEYLRPIVTWSTLRKIGSFAYGLYAPALLPSYALERCMGWQEWSEATYTLAFIHHNATN